MQEIVLKGLDEKIYYDVCDNGLPIYMLLNDRVNKFYITYNVKYGSIDTEYKVGEEVKKVHNGVAHFLEHVNFNEADGVTAHDYFNKLGSSINAFTTFDFTSYEVFASNNFKDNLEHLIDYVQTPYFTKNLIEKEKGIIVEEVRMGKNNPGHKLYYGMNKALYKKDKRRNCVTGEEKDVVNTTVEELQNIYDTFYHPMNSFIVITGNFDPEEAIKIIKDNQSKKKFKKYLEPTKMREKEPSKVNTEYKEIEANVEIPKVRICYKMPKSIFEGFDDVMISIYLSIILRNNFGITSVLKEELLKKELIVCLCIVREIFNDVVTLEINMESRCPEKAIPIVMDKMKNLEIDEESLKRRIRCNISSLINDYDDIEYVNTDIMDQLINHKKIIDDMFERYNSLNIEDAMEIRNRLDLNNHSTVLLVPYRK